MSLIIRAAARTLPANIRERYREQWLADVRDAPEAGVSPASIALAALAFAVTYDRPFPARRVPTAEQRAQRSRLAVGLGLSAALLSLSTYPYITFNGLTGNTAWDFTTFFTTSLLMAFGVLAPFAALVLVRGRRARTAVVLFAFASVTPVLQGLLNQWNSQVDIYWNFGSVAFLTGVLFVLAGCALVWRPAAPSGLRAPLVGAVSVWAITALGITYAAAFAWPNRTPLVWGGDMAYYKEWVLLKQQFEALVNDVFVGWAITGAVFGILVFLAARRVRHSLSIAFVASALSVLVASGIFGFLELGIGGTVYPVLLDPLRLVAQVVLVAVTLVAVGGIRYLPRVRHRHDVEGAV